MKIAIGSDHAGYEAKQALVEHLRREGLEFLDFGTYTEKSCDYPDFAVLVALSVARGEVDRGVLLCGTGIGMSISANKIDGVRAALCHDEQTVRMSREHNDANILCLGTRILDLDRLISCLDLWIQTPFSGDRHARRVSKIHTLERQG